MKSEPLEEEEPVVKALDWDLENQRSVSYSLLHHRFPV